MWSMTRKEAARRSGNYDTRQSIHGDADIVPNWRGFIWVALAYAATFRGILMHAAVVA